MRQLLFLLINISLVGVSTICHAQNLYNQTNWPIGRNAVLSFTEQGVVCEQVPDLNHSYGCAVYTNSSGDLLFSIGDQGIYDFNQNRIISTDYKSLDAVVIPLDEKEEIFTIPYVATNGQVNVIEYNYYTQEIELIGEGLINQSISHLTAVKHCIDNGYWLITSSRDRFYTFLINEFGISDAVESLVGIERSQTGDLRSSRDGKYLALSHYDQDKVELFSIDRSCGNILYERELKKLTPDDNRPLSVCFSPDSKSIYVAWGYQHSRISQYFVDRPGTIYNVFSYPENINSLEIGPDGDMYVGVHENGNLSRRIHKIPGPNATGGGNRVSLDVVDMPIGTSNGWEFPNFINNHTQGECEEHSDLWDLLGDEYYICDIEEETVVIDAGEGFKTYRWTPTGDTTQWIEVKEVGEYVVVVGSFDGCMGMSGTVVSNRCDLSYHVPNAFTPNTDGLNDYFQAVGEQISNQKVNIYNRWGELIYSGRQWDGSDAQSGVYYYQIEIEGFRNKKEVKHLEAGTVHLIR